MFPTVSINRVRSVFQVLSGRYLTLGIKPFHDEVHKRKVRFANKFLSFCIFLIVLLAVTEVTTGKMWVLPMHAARVVGLVVALYHLYRDRYFVSIYIALYTIFIVSIVGTALSPVANTFHYITFPLCGISFYLTDGKKGNVLFVFFNMLYFIAADYYNMAYLPRVLSMSHVYSIVIIFVVFYFAIGIYVWEARFFEKIIATKNTNLQQQNTLLEQQNHQLSELNALKNNIFSILGHDLRSPFNNIVGFSTILQRNFKTNDVEKNERLIQLMVDSIQQTSQLMDDLLYWGQCQNNRIEIKNELVPISPVFQEVILLYQSMIINKGVFVSIASMEVLECVTDRTVISTIVRNLFANAIKFTPKNGKITFSTSIIEGQVAIAVSDTGLGFSNEKYEQFITHKRIVSSPGTNSESGNGFGLILCSELAAKIAATIKLESVENQGTTAMLVLPRNKSEV